MKQTKTHNFALIEQVGRMYYILRMNQQMIADKLGLSRTTVVRLLAEGRELGIIQISICGQDRSLRNIEMETELMNIYNLRDIVVVRDVELNAVYNVAAKYVQGIIPENGTIAISGGNTVYEMANYFYPVNKAKELKIVQLTGVFGEAIPSVAVVQRWSEKLNAQAVYLSAPGVVATVRQRELFMEEFNIKKAYEHMKQAEIAITSIGTTADVLQNVSDDYPKDLFRKLEEKSVGDIMFHFFDKDGRFNAPEVSEKVVGATIDDYMGIPNRIVVAFGDRKVKAIHAAMKGRLANIIITDQETAEQLLKINANAQKTK